MTARKRAESLQDTPISITAFTGNSLDARGITRIEEITALTPNLVYQNIPAANGSSSAAAIYIRGVGQRDYAPTVEPGVGLYIDDVYLARSVGGVLDLIDVERIEVLRGPQGTLFGRNTIGGAVSITTQKPGDTLSARADVTYGTDNRVDVRGSLDVPINDKGGVRVSIGHFRQDGFINRPADDIDLGDRNRLVGRLNFEYRPTETLKVNIALDGTRARENGPAFLLRGIDYSSNTFNPNNRALLPPAPPFSPFALADGGVPAGPFSPGREGILANPALLPPGIPTSTIFYQYALSPQGAPLDIPTDNFALLNNYIATNLGGQDCLAVFAPYDPAGPVTNPACYNQQYVREGERVNLGTFPAFSNDDIWGASLSLEWQATDAITVRSITAYRSVESTYSRDEDMSPLQVAQFAGLLDQEQFSQEIQVLGEMMDSRLQWIVGAFYLTEEAVSSEPIEFTPVIAVSGGLVENKSYAAFAQATFAATDQLSVTAGLRYTKDVKRFTPEQFIIEDLTGGTLLDLSCQFIPENNPDCNLTLPRDRRTTRPDALTPMVNIAYDWSPDFMTYATFSQGFKSGGFAQRVFPPLPEAPSFDSETVTAYEVGFKLEAFSSALRLNGAAFHTSYDDIQVEVFTGIAPVVQNAASARIRGFELEFAATPAEGWFIEATAGYIDAAFQEVGANVTEVSVDNAFEYIPEWSLSAGLSKAFYVEDIGSFTPRLDWSYRSQVFTDARNTAAIAQPGYSLFDATLTWESSSQQFSLVAGIRNIADKDFIDSAFFNPTVGSQTVVPNRGRQWFLTGRVKF